MSSNGILLGCTHAHLDRMWPLTNLLVLLVLFTCQTNEFVYQLHLLAGSHVTVLMVSVHHLKQCQTSVPFSLRCISFFLHTSVRFSSAVLHLVLIDWHVRIPGFNLHSHLPFKYSAWNSCIKCAGVKCGILLHSPWNTSIYVFGVGIFKDGAE